jgi:long-subunit fatty acid transport protein
MPWRFTPVVALVCATAVDIAAAQTGNRAIEFEDFGFDRPLYASARGFALGAFAATVNDASALAVNPAGLARIRRRSGALSVMGAHSNVDYTYAITDNTRSDTHDEVALQFLGGVFPIPVLRGSLVPAIGVQRIFSSSLDLSYQGYNAVDERDDRFALQQSGGTYAYHVGAAGDIAHALALGIGVMVLDGHIDRVRDYDVRGRVVDPNVHTFVYEDMDADVSGYGARFGLLINASPRLHLGVVFTTPLALKVHGTTVTEETRQVDNDVGTFTRETTGETTEYQVPYRFDMAFAIPASRSLLLTAQFGYADWSEATVGDKRLVTTDLDRVMRSVSEISAGVEWTLPRWPVRVRGGFAHTRSPSGYQEADRIDNDQLETIDDESATVRVSLGVACLLRGSIAIDAAVAHTQGERISVTVGDARNVTSASIGCGYWF